MNRYYRTPYNSYANRDKAFIQEYPVPLSAVGNVFREDNLSFFGPYEDTSSTTTSSGDSGFDWNKTFAAIGEIAGAVKVGYQNMNTTYKQLSSQTLNQTVPQYPGGAPAPQAQSLSLPIIVGGGVVALVIIILLILKVKK
jgi:hypothetical protein